MSIKYYPVAEILDLSVTFCAEEGVRDVGRVVDADADADDEKSARNGVHGDVCGGSMGM